MSLFRLPLITPEHTYPPSHLINKHNKLIFPPNRQSTPSKVASSMGTPSQLYSTTLNISNKAFMISRLHMRCVLILFYMTWPKSQLNITTKSYNLIFHVLQRYMPPTCPCHLSSSPVSRLRRKYIKTIQDAAHASIVILLQWC